MEDPKNQNSSEQRKRKLAIALLCILLSALAVVPYFFMGRPEEGDTAPAGFTLRQPDTHDMFLHWDQMKSFYQGLHAGEIYPRWEEETNYGFGAPTTSYYPPGVYYVTAFFYAITGDWTRTLLDAELLFMLASAAAIYVYSRRCMSRLAAIAVMTCYVFLPYHLIDQYQRGAIAELLAFVWVPLMFLFGERLMGVRSWEGQGNEASWRSRLTGVAGLALVYGLFLWSHPPTAYQATLAFFVFIVVLAILRREWKGVLLVGLGLGGGGALAAAYLLPAAVEQEMIRHEYVSESWPYHNTYIFVHNIFNREVHAEFFNRLDAIWIFSTLAIVIAAVAILASTRRVKNFDRDLRDRVLGWVAAGLFTSFMMIRYSEPIGRHIPKIDIGVFTWRMLTISTVVVALLAGACLEVFQRTRGRLEPKFRRVLALFGISVVAGGLLFSVANVGWPMLYAPFFYPQEHHLNYAIIPRTAPDDPDDFPQDVPQAELESDFGTVTVEDWKPQHRVIQANLTDDDVLLVRTFYFPGWTAKVDGTPAEIKIGEELGDMEIAVPQGSHRVELVFGTTKVRRVAAIITVCTAGLIVFCFVAATLARQQNPATVEVAV